MVRLPEKKFWQWALPVLLWLLDQKAATYFGPCLAVALQNKVFKKSQSWIGIFKDCLAVFNNSACCV